MSQDLTPEIRGLYTFPNDFSKAPKGALSVADNIIIDRDSIAEPRKGFTFLAKTAGIARFVTSTDRAHKFFFYDDTILAHTKDGSGNQKLQNYNSSTGWAYNPAFTGSVNAYEFNQPDANNKVRAAAAKQNLYLTHALGPHRLDDRTAAPVIAGMPQGLLGLGSSVVTTFSTSFAWLEDDKAVSYRVVWCQKDANGNVYYGPPSQFEIVTNTSGVTGWPLVVHLIPETVTAGKGFYFQVYRSDKVDISITPNDELKLVGEREPDAGEFALGYCSFSDYTPDELNDGAYLYTNASQQGIDLANYNPPYCTDLAWFRDCMFYANISDNHSYILRLLTVKEFKTPVASPLTSPSYVVIGGTKYNAVVSTPIPSDPWYAEKYFLIYPSGTDALKVELTTKSLIDAINRASSTLYAVYLSGPDDLPGRFLIRAYNAGGSSFALTSDVINAWLPQLPSSGTSQSSTNEVAANGIACSKPLEPEHVPLPYRWYAGSKDSAILRIIPLRDSLFILKEDGAYRLFGTDPSNFQIAELDSTANIIAPDTAVVLNNQIFALTTQGVVAITETGVTIMSRPIEGDLLALLQTNPTVLKKESFAVSYESQRSYYLWVPQYNDDTYPTQYYRYNTITNNWTRGTMGKKCGGVNPVDDKLYLGLVTKDFVYVENKTGSSLDYCDYLTSEVISDISGKTVTMSGSSSVEVGQVLLQVPNFATKTGTCGAGGVFDHTTNEITINNHGFLTGLKIALSINSGALPAGLSSTNYYIIRSSANVFKLSSSYVGAIAGTPVLFTDNGNLGSTATFNPSESEIWGEVEEVGATTVTTKYPAQFIVGSTDIVAPIETKMVWIPSTFGNPGINKHVREATIMFLSDFYGEGLVSYRTDLTAKTQYETVRGSMPAPWGRFPWGAAPWGGCCPRRRPLRTMVPRVSQMGSFHIIGFEHAVCFSPWAIQGISLIGNPVSEKVWHEGGGYG